MVQHTPGAFVECGVGCFQALCRLRIFAVFFEPYHYVRRLIGFDTFAGFAGITDKDTSSKAEHLKTGGLHFDTYDKMHRSAELFDRNRALGNIPKIEFVKGDISATFPTYIEENPSLVIAMLYLDLDLYQGYD